MSVKIRLKRMGGKKKPFFRFVAIDSRKARDGRFIEMLGWYSSIEKPARVHVKENETYEWLKKGAQPSDTVRTLFKQIGLWRKWEMMKKGEDPSALTITDRIKERPKHRKGKKAVARAEAEKAAVEAPPVEVKEEAPAAEEAPAEEEAKEE